MFKKKTDTKEENPKVRITKGNVATATTDGIVNAANESLVEGAGVCGAIFDEARRGGGHAELTRACHDLNHCPTGDAVSTPGHGLAAKWVIHAVGPVWQGRRNVMPAELDGTAVRQLRELADAYRAVLRECRTHGMKSVTIPGISTGIFGLPKELGSAIAVTVCREEAGDVEVDLIAFDEESHTVLQAAPSAAAMALMAGKGIID